VAELLDIEVRVNSSEGEASFDRMRASIARMEEALRTGRSDQLIGAMGRAAATLGRESTVTARGVEQLAQSLASTSARARETEGRLIAAARQAQELGAQSQRAALAGRGIAEGFAGASNAASSIGLLSGALGQLATAAVGALSIRSLFATFAEADRAFEMARAFDISTERLIVLTRTAEQFGADAGDLQQAFRGLSQSISDALKDPGGTASQRFKDLKIDAEALRGISLDEALLRVADGLSTVEDSATRTDAAVDLLRVRNANLFSMLRNGRGDIEAAAAEIERFAGVSEESARAADRFGDSVGRMVGTVKAQVLALAPVFATLAENIEKALQGIVVNFNAGDISRIVVETEVIGKEKVEELQKLFDSLPKSMQIQVETLTDNNQRADFLEGVSRARRLRELPAPEQTRIREETQRQTEGFRQSPVGALAPPIKAPEVDRFRAQIEEQLLAEAEKRLGIEKAKAAPSARELAIQKRIIDLQAEEERLRVDRIAKLRLHGPETTTPPIPPEIPRAPIDRPLPPQNLPIDTHLTRDRRGEVTSTQIGEIQTDREREEARRKSAAALRPQEVEEQAGALTKLRDVISDLGTIAGATKSRIDDLIVGLGSLVTSMLKLVQDLSRAKGGVGGEDVAGQVMDNAKLARSIGREVGDSVQPLVEAGQNVASSGFRDDEPTADEFAGPDQPLDLSRQSIFQLAEAIQPGTEEASPLPQAQRLAERVAPPLPAVAPAPVALSTRTVRALGEEIRTEVATPEAPPRPAETRRLAEALRPPGRPETQPGTTTAQPIPAGPLPSPPVETRKIVEAIREPARVAETQRPIETRKLAEALRPAAQSEARTGPAAAAQRPAGPAVGPLTRLQAAAAGREPEAGRVREPFGPAEKAEQAATARSEQLGRELEPVVERLRAPIREQAPAEPSVQELPAILAPERPALPELPDLRLKPQKVQLEAPEVQLPPTRRVAVEPERIRPALLREPPAPREAPTPVARPVARPVAERPAAPIRPEVAPAVARPVAPRVARPAEPAPPALERLRPAAQAPQVRELPKPPAVPVEVERPRLLREPPAPEPTVRPGRETIRESSETERHVRETVRTERETLPAPPPERVRSPETRELAAPAPEQVQRPRLLREPPEPAIPTVPPRAASVRELAAQPARPEVAAREIARVLRPVSEDMSEVPRTIQRLGAARQAPVTELGALLRREEPAGRLRPISARQFLETQQQLAPARTALPTATASVGPAAGAPSRGFVEALTVPIRAALRPVGAAVSAVAAPVGRALRPAVDAASSIFEPVSRAFAPVARAISAPFRAVVQPVVGAVERVALPIGRGVEALAAPVVSAVAAPFRAAGFLRDEGAPIGRSAAGVALQGPQTAAQAAGGFFGTTIAPAIKIVSSALPVFGLITSFLGSISSGRRERREREMQEFERQAREGGPKLVAVHEQRLARERQAEEQVTAPTPPFRFERGPELAPSVTALRGAAVIPAPERELATVSAPRGQEDRPATAAAIARITRQEQPATKAADLIRQISTASRTAPAPASQAAQRAQAADELSRRQQLDARQGNKIDLSITALDAKGVVDLFSSEKGRDARRILAEFVGVSD